MDIVLLNSSPNVDNKSTTAYRTLGPYKLAHTCRNNGYSVQVIDHCRYWDKETFLILLRKFVDEKTLVVGISSTFLSDDFLYRINDTFAKAVNTIAEEFPQVKVIIGGTSYALAQYSSNLKVHAAVKGFAEDTFLEIVNNIAGRGQQPSFQFIYNTKLNFHYKLYSDPIESRFNIEHENFKFVEADCILPNETLPIEISRGCIFKCKFCNHLLLGRGKLDYLREFELIKDELVHNYEKWGITNYYVICDTFNDTEYKMQEWYKMVTSLPFKISYTVYLRADLLDRMPDVPYMLKESGLLSAFHGIETFGQQAAVTIGKGWSHSKARTYLPKLYHDIWNNEVHQTLSFIAGLPGDTRESLIDTTQWFVDNDMYNFNMHVLGLSGDKTLQKNFSEFERNLEQYGFTFPFKYFNDQPDWRRWKTDYWERNEVIYFVTNWLGPIYHPHNARYGSWAILNLMQYGYDKSMFLKARKNDWNLHDMQQRQQQHIKLYQQKLLAL